MLNFIKSLFKKSTLVKKKERILVIEDNPVDQRIVVAAIERGRYTALVASTGQEGLTLARQHKPDLIVLDYLLPDIVGPDVCAQLKENHDTKNIPVLFLTSIETPSGVVNCFDKGGDNYLSKPISPKMLLMYIEDLLREIDHD